MDGELGAVGYRHLRVREHQLHRPSMSPKPRATAARRPALTARFFQRILTFRS
jgi:hypothetical protein